MSEITNQDVQKTSITQPRLWPALVILTLGIGRQIWIWNFCPPDRTVQTINAYLSGLPTVLALGLWWLFFSRISWRMRGLGVGIVFAMIGLLACVLRFDDVTGEVFPMFAWRWTPRRAALAKAYFHEQRQQKQLESSKPATLDSELPHGESDVADPKTSHNTPSDLQSGVSLKTSFSKLNEAGWPEFRGPLRDGVIRDGQIRTDWDARPPVALWKHPVGPGWSSFSIVNGLAFTQEQRTDEQDRDVEAVVCYDVWTGRQIWEHQDLGLFTHTLGGNGPRATPTWFEGRLYSFGATGILNCLDPLTGKKIWSHDVLAENSIPNAEYGMTGSPLVHGDLVIVNPGGADGKGLMAFDRLTGKPVWEQGQDKAGYSSLQVSNLDGVPQLMAFDAAGVSGHELTSGKQLWKFPWTNNPGINAAQPIIPQTDQVLVSTSYGVGSILLRVKHSELGWNVDPIWESKQLRLKFNCGVLRDQYLFGLDEGILTCLDLRDGTKKWKGGRYSFGQILLFGDKLLVLTEAGDMVLVVANPDRFQELTRFHALEGKTWSNPAVWKGLLLVRNSTEAACYDLRME